ncbi:MAG: HDOD domain-containing protein [Polyangiaceae bacterium]
MASAKSWKRAWPLPRHWPRRGAEPWDKQPQDSQNRWSKSFGSVTKIRATTSSRRRVRSRPPWRRRPGSSLSQWCWRAPSRRSGTQTSPAPRSWACSSRSALCARLLRVANSALYAPKRECVSVSDAIMRLGNKNVSDIISGIAVYGMFSDVGGLGARVRDHSACVASMARVLAVEWVRDGAEHVFLAGLMHDVGKLLMMQAGTPRYELLDPALLREPDRIHLSERELTGFDHATLGAHVLREWKFPSDVARVVAWHHQPGRAFAAGAEVGLPVALIRLADRIEALAGTGDAPDPTFAETLASDESAAYTNFGAKQLELMWSKLRQACTETLRALK